MMDEHFGIYDLQVAEAQAKAVRSAFLGLFGIDKGRLGRLRRSLSRAERACRELEKAKQSLGTEDHQAARFVDSAHDLAENAKIRLAHLLREGNGDGDAG